MTSHLIIEPVLQTADTMYACQPGEHTGWSIILHEADGTVNACGVVTPDRDVDVRLKELYDAHPGIIGVQVRWLDDAGAVQRTAVGTPNEVVDALMETVCDETPEDAETTDDHPLEEARTFLDELSQRLEGPVGPGCP